MGIDFYIAEEQIRITNAKWYNKFLNWVADQGDYPQILNHSPINGRYRLKATVPPTLYDGSIPQLKKELMALTEKKPPVWAQHILSQMLEGIELALDIGVEITMDDGAWYGS